jgi:hypothetical protein
MGKKTISYLLKTVTVLLFAVFLFTGLYLVPSYVGFMQRYYVPAIASYSVWILLYINLAFVPVYACLFMAWRVFSTVERDEAFCAENAKRLRISALLSMMDAGMVLGFYLYLQFGFSFLLSDIYLFITLCLILFGVSVALACFALSKLVAQASELKQEMDLTV